MNLDQVIKNVWAAFGVIASGELIGVWDRTLKDLDGPHLRQAMKEAAEGEHRPNLGTVKTRAMSLRASANIGAKTDHVLTPAQKQRADVAAIKSMLWLHYFKGWQLRSFSGHVLGRLFGGDPQHALQTAKSQFSKDDIGRWMDNEKARDESEDRNRARAEGWVYKS